MKTKGAILWGAGQPWSVEEIELGEPRAGEVLVQMEAAGLCHTEEHARCGDQGGGGPLLGGHEGSGVVMAVGDGVTSVQVGDHVVTAFIPACGKCEPCASGRQNLCDYGAYLMTGKAISDGTARVRARGQDITQYCLLGTFAPYICVHESSVIKIEPDIPLDLAALVSCGVTTGWGSATNVAEVRTGDAVIVMGAGGVGMNAVQGAAAAGARSVIVIDPAETKRTWAKDFGATHTFASVEDAFDRVRDITWGRMADKVIITVGSIRGENVQQALSLIGKGGRAVVTAQGRLGDVDLKLNLFELTLWQKDLRGAVFGGGSPRAEIPRMLSLYREGKLKLSELLTTKYRLEDINQGYADTLDGKNIRGVVAFTDADR